jgi:carboxypeptidase Taq
MTPLQAYQELIALYRERSLLESVATVLGWDEETYMPIRGGDHRAEQHALIARLEHEQSSDPRLGDLLALAETAAHPEGSVEPINLRVLRREYDEAQLMPTSLVEDLARTSTLARIAWEDARDRRDPADYLPSLTRVIELVRAASDCVRGTRTRYDACLDHWEPELAEADVLALFAKLGPQVVALVDQIEGAPRPLDEGRDPTAFPVAIDTQRRINDTVARWLGFDFDCGRLDEAAHPSTMAIGPHDIRLTTRYDELRPFDGLFSTLHEVGHGLYDQRLPAEHRGTPAGEARSIAVHESQSRFVENVIGRSRAFLGFALPRIQELAAPALDGISVERLYRAINRVARTTNRVHADEVTYDLHISIRVELERALLYDDLAVADLPGAWDDAYARVLVRPRDAATGFLQDGHWAAGMFGYFPTYTLGNVIAAQLAHAMRDVLPDLDDQLASGRLASVTGWLTDRIHRHGGRYTANELVARITGGPLDATEHVARLRQRYAPLYEL